jgi:hypothetical protein
MGDTAHTGRESETFALELQNKLQIYIRNVKYLKCEKRRIRVRSLILEFSKEGDNRHLRF